MTISLFQLKDEYFISLLPMLNKNPTCIEHLEAVFKWRFLASI